MWRALFLLETKTETGLGLLETTAVTVTHAT